MKKLLPLFVALVLAYIGFTRNGTNTIIPHQPAEPAAIAATGGDAIFATAFANHQRNIPVHGSAVVTKVLSDDTEGLRHQRFIIRLASGQSLLVAHDIDQADRVDGLRAGDNIEFTGEYVWTPQGGVVHWTHHDSSGRHAPGWIKWNGRVYQ